MNVNLSKNAGFCPGVRKADNEIQKFLSEKHGVNVYTLGELIHNRLYNESLEAKGVKSIELCDVEKQILYHSGEQVVLFIRTHGIPKEQQKILSDLEEKYDGFKVYDLTCPYVKKIHKIAAENTNDTTYFLLYCSPNHPEAVGIMSYANGKKLAFSSLSELEGLDLEGKTPILCSQTTQNLNEFEKIKLFLK